jgi:hypothetical protein
VTVKIKFDDFQPITRSQSLPGAACPHAGLRDASVALIRSVLPADKGIRLVGITVPVSKPRQQRTYTAFTIRAKPDGRRQYLRSGRSLSRPAGDADLSPSHRNGGRAGIHPTLQRTVRRTFVKGSLACASEDQGSIDGAE